VNRTMHTANKLVPKSKAKNSSSQQLTIDPWSQPSAQCVCTPTHRATRSTSLSGW
jgi:hypothetical protein